MYQVSSLLREAAFLRPSPEVGSVGEVFTAANWSNKGACKIILHLPFQLHMETVSKKNSVFMQPNQDDTTCLDLKATCASWHCLFRDKFGLIWPSLVLENWRIVCVDKQSFYKWKPSRTKCPSLSQWVNDSPLQLHLSHVQRLCWPRPEQTTCKSQVSGKTL